MLTPEDKADIRAIVVEALATERPITAAAIEHSETKMRDFMTAALVAKRSITAAAIERTETNLLTAFHKWASPVELRQSSHSAAICALDLKVDDIAERLTKLERRGEQAH